MKNSDTTPETAATDQDQVRRFIIEEHPVRGHWVHLENAWRSVREHKDYPPAIRDLLGEALSAAVLLAATLKFQGTLTLQLQGNGEVHLLVAQCTHDFHVRAVARYGKNPPLRSEAIDPNSFKHLVGDEGRVIVTIEAAERDMRYQGIVPLTGNSLSECLESYFATSEQLPTKVRLVADADRAAGFLVQRLPSAEEEKIFEFSDEDDPVELRSPWEDAQHAATELQAVELLGKSLEEVLQNHLGDHDVRLFKPQSVQFECRCNPERVHNILRALGADEVRDVLKEQGSVTVTCDYCDRPYRFDAEDVERLFAPAFVPSPPSSLQ
jgi:molecular chaperone Hsp33